MTEMFSDEDVQEGREAARGGTMTAEGVKDALSELRETVEIARDLENFREDDLLRIWQVEQHITAQGARLSVAEAERDTARLAITAGNGMLEDARKERDEALRVRASLLATQANIERERDNAITSEAVWRKRLEALRAAGAVLSAHVDKTAGEVSPMEAFNAQMNMGLDAAHEQGAEAMRVACWEALQTWAQGRGLTREETQSLKAAFEGATP